MTKDRAYAWCLFFTCPLWILPVMVYLIVMLGWELSAEILTIRVNEMEEFVRECRKPKGKP